MKNFYVIVLACFCVLGVMAQERHIVANEDGVDIAYFGPDFRGAVVTHKADRYQDAKYTGRLEVPRFVDLPVPHFLTTIVSGLNISVGALTSVNLKWTENGDFNGYEIIFCGSDCPVLRVYFKGVGNVSFEVKAKGGGSISWGQVDEAFDGSGGTLQSGDASDFVTRNVDFNISDDGIHYVEFSGTALENANTELRVVVDEAAIPADGSTVRCEVYALDKEAFRQCKDMTTLILPASIDLLGDLAISYYDTLEKIVLPTPKVPALGADVFKYNNAPTVVPTLYVLESLIDEYRANSAFANLNIEALESPTLSSAEILPMMGKETQLTISGMEDGASAAWSSSDPAVATVSSTGLVKALKIGQCEINAHVEPFDLKCTVIVMPYDGVERGEDGGFRASELAIADGTVYDNPYDIKVDELTYSRTFPHTGWNALFVPFDISYEEWSEHGDVAQFNNMHQYDKDGDGVREVTVVEFNRVTSGSIRPNTPYVFKPKAAGAVSFVCHDKFLTAAPEHPATVECSSTSVVYTMAGTYQPMSGAQTSGIYCLSGGEFKQVAAGAALQPMRIFITISPKENAYGNEYPASMPSRIGISIDGEEAGVSDPAADFDAGLPVYDLMGRAVKNPGPGIYVRNGKKIYIR